MGVGVGVECFFSWRAVLVATGCGVKTGETDTNPSGAAPAVSRVEPWRKGAAPMAWAGGRIFFNEKRHGTDVFEGWSAKPDGTDVKLVTGSRYPAGTQHGITDVTPDGRYVLLAIERSQHGRSRTERRWRLPGPGPTTTSGSRRRTARRRGSCATC